MATKPSQSERESDLPPVPANHGFAVSDRVEMPLYGGKTIQGVIEHIDIVFGKKRYRGLAVLGDDGRYYEFHPELARRL
jgi:hypothetical protein